MKIRKTVVVAASGRLDQVEDMSLDRFFLKVRERAAGAFDVEERIRSLSARRCESIAKLPEQDVLSARDFLLRRQFEGVLELVKLFVEGITLTYETEAIYVDLSMCMPAIRDAVNSETTLLSLNSTINIDAWNTLRDICNEFDQQPWNFRNAFELAYILKWCSQNTKLMDDTSVFQGSVSLLAAHIEIEYKKEVETCFSLMEKAIPKGLSEMTSTILRAKANTIIDVSTISEEFAKQIFAPIGKLTACQLTLENSTMEKCYEISEEIKKNALTFDWQCTDKALERASKVLSSKDIEAAYDVWAYSKPFGAEEWPLLEYTYSSTVSVATLVRTKTATHFPIFLSLLQISWLNTGLFAEWTLLFHSAKLMTCNSSFT